MTNADGSQSVQFEQAPPTPPTPPTPAHRARGLLDKPVEVEPSLRTIRVTAAVPCFNRPSDLALLAEDLKASCLIAQLPDAQLRIELRVIIVDNASTPPLAKPDLGAAIACDLVRLTKNTGGSGGFNIGLAKALHTQPDSLPHAQPDYLWLLDSDARVEPHALSQLVNALETHKNLVMVGPALAEPDTGEIHEVGGWVDRSTGRFGSRTVPPSPVPATAHAHAHTKENTNTHIPVVRCDYVAACCALVRADTARQVGLLPETFLNGDDVQWCIELTRCTGRHIAVVPSVRASHPRFDRFATLARYFGARNAFGPLGTLELPRRVVFRRALFEAARALNQELMARPDLARLHLRGLRDRARGIVSGCPVDLPTLEHTRPLDRQTLATALTEVLCKDGTHPTQSLMLDLPKSLSQADRDIVHDALTQVGCAPKPTAAIGLTSTANHTQGFLARLSQRIRFVWRVVGFRPKLAIVPAKGSPDHWLAAETMVELIEGEHATFVVRPARRSRVFVRALMTACKGTWYSLGIAFGQHNPNRLRSPLPRPEIVLALAPIEHAPSQTQHAFPAHTQCTCSVVVLSYNRCDALRQTLDRLSAMHEHGLDALAEVIVVDNASADGSVAMVEALIEHQHDDDWLRLIALDTNETIAGFNRGAKAAQSQCVLILDDDARPDAAALGLALELLARRPEIGAVTFEPVHPRTGAHEWPFARTLDKPCDDWPVMGCCNLVRRSIWEAVGGYAEAFWLYRNDVDLAMTILALGKGVYFDPAWTCEHDSPVAARKSKRWFELATRNWLWLSRRHGHSYKKWLGAGLGVLWAHKLAGFSLAAHARVLKGTARGVFTLPPRLPEGVLADGRAYARLLSLRFAKRHDRK